MEENLTRIIAKLLARFTFRGFLVAHWFTPVGPRVSAPAYTPLPYANLITRQFSHYALFAHDIQILPSTRVLSCPHSIVIHLSNMLHVSCGADIAILLEAFEDLRELSRKERWKRVKSLKKITVIVKAFMSFCTLIFYYRILYSHPRSNFIFRLSLSTSCFINYPRADAFIKTKTNENCSKRDQIAVSTVKIFSQKLLRDGEKKRTNIRVLRIFFFSISQSKINFYYTFVSFNNSRACRRI